MEGFDEPFNTMKSIAEYFRDLAADDRYFGAEPPTPDAEMLHRIAEREIQKRVEARVEKDGVVLRQADADVTTQTAIGATAVEAGHLLTDASTAAAESSASEHAPTSQPDIAQDAPTPSVAEDEDIAQPDAPIEEAPVTEAPQADEAPLNTPVSGSIADKLSRIRAVVDEKRAEGAAAFVATDQYAEDQDLDRADVSNLFVDADEIEDLPDATEAEVEMDPDTAADTDTAAQDAEDEDAQPPQDLRSEDDEAPLPDALTAEEEENLSPAEIRKLRRSRRAQRAQRLRELARAELAAQDMAQDEDEDDEQPVSELQERGLEEDTQPREDAQEESLQDEDLEDETDIAEGSSSISSVLATVAKHGRSNVTLDDEAADQDNQPSASVAETAEPEALDQERGQGEDTISGILSRLNNKPKAEEASAEITEPEVTEPEISESAETEADLAEQDDIASEDTDLDMAEEAATERDDPHAEETAEEDAAQEEDTSPRPVALRKPRVIRVRHVKGGQLSSPKDDASQDNENAMLTPEAEAELMAELAEAEAEAVAAQTDETSAQAPQIDDAPAIEEAPAGDTTIESGQINSSATDAALEEAIEDKTAEVATEERAETRDLPKLTAFDDGGVSDSEDALDRLLAEADTHMASTEVSRRRSAIAHLKAAVQAKRADDTHEDASGKNGDDSVGAYRDDLARVVRPRRPGISGGSSRRMPPLVLVSEQRVDEMETIEEAPAAPASSDIVRPRRVLRNPQADLAQDEISEDTATEQLDAGFIDYVEQTGAHELGELLEAAACHTVLLNGYESFTRPRVMGMVRRYVGEEEFSREEGLRAFGKLLREGRIKRLKRGQFALTESTRFRPGSGSDGETDGRQSA
ncbi:hypothetical protein K3X41_09010 [Aliiroseovarius crassostreae]|uniref:hypothetical protein n=1 Tax=Aliiroseovarius crassostreae TaxID=154981 RepID=UPI0022046987|nr:hypothetical protein [Aliiroseovarius crassostreae]UWQ10077.1 hypothetical protein K3X41_09010 [Aliiroseovarius crassostreae]